MSDYCIENDLARQQEEACIAQGKRELAHRDLKLSFQFVNCAVGNLLKNAKQVMNHRAGIPTTHQSNYRLIYTESQWTDVVESLKVLKERIDALD